ncbi:hypothetical protein QVD17_07228 [Tagetes erecta]|uniref:Uncharacterized protein n=1 Tax=Tagetes erecta TaxID=13708 RepID=A0AAD8PBY4_TARER|nr:hypothetical protein QVD17_07228 [Tagetes erecta]
MMKQRLDSTEIDQKYTVTAPSEPPPPTPKLTSKIPPPMFFAPAAAPKTTPNQPPTQLNPKLKWTPTTATVSMATTTTSTLPNILKQIVKLMFEKEEITSISDATKRREWHPPWCPIDTTRMPSDDSNGVHRGSD